MKTHFVLRLLTLVIWLVPQSSHGFDWFSSTETNSAEELKLLTIDEVKATSEYKSMKRYCGPDKWCRQKLAEFIKAVGRAPATDDELEDLFGCSYPNPCDED